VPISKIIGRATKKPVYTLLLTIIRTPRKGCQEPGREVVRLDAHYLGGQGPQKIIGTSRRGLQLGNHDTLNTEKDGIR